MVMELALQILSKPGLVSVEGKNIPEVTVGPSFKKCGFINTHVTEDDIEWNKKVIRSAADWMRMYLKNILTKFIMLLFSFFFLNEQDW